MKICVTGGAGYIGAVAVRKLIEIGYEVLIFDDLSTGHQENIPANIAFIKGSLLDPTQIAQALAGVDAVMHFAGKSLVGESVEKPELYKRVNIEGSRNLFNEMKLAGISKLIFSSSAATYGEPIAIPINETHPTVPTNPYGASKLATENLIKNYGFNSISLRYFNVAGSYEEIREKHQPETHLIPNILKASKEEPISIFGNDWPTPDKTCIRDYVHVEDVIDAHIASLEKITDFESEVINIGSGKGFSIKEVIQCCEKVLGRSVPVIQKERRLGDPAILLADISKANKVLNWSPKKNLENMVN